MTDSLTGDEKIALQIRCYQNDGMVQETSFYIDCISAVVNRNKWPLYSTWQIGGSPRANEIMAVPITGLGEQYSVSFEWYPRSSYLLVAQDVPIASILGVDGSYLDIMWEYSSQKIKICELYRLIVAKIIIIMLLC